MIAQSQKLKAVETVVDHHFPGLRQTRVKDGLSLYLQGKMKQWNAEMSSVDGVFQKNIDRLRLLVRQLIRENDVLRDCDGVVDMVDRCCSKNKQYR